jgi:hypothetical protein
MMPAMLMPMIASDADACNLSKILMTLKASGKCS